jgi:sugar-specific transcriptional regulator TrmB
MLARLEEVCDAMAGDILYHGNCIRLAREILDDTDRESTGEVSHSDILLQIYRELKSKVERGCTVFLEDFGLGYKTM